MDHIGQRRIAEMLVMYEPEFFVMQPIGNLTTQETIGWWLLTKDTRKRLLGYIEGGDTIEPNQQALYGICSRILDGHRWEVACTFVTNSLSPLVIAYNTRDQSVLCEITYLGSPRDIGFIVANALIQAHEFVQMLEQKRIK